MKVAGFVLLILAVAVPVYVLLRNRWPAMARFSLCVAGGTIGALVPAGIAFYLIRFFWPSWTGFGIGFWALPILLIFGCIAGILSAVWWTEGAAAQRRKLGRAVLVTVSLAPVTFVVLPTAVSSVLNDPNFDTMHRREAAIGPFAATRGAIVFTVPTRDGVMKLVFVDRATRHAQLIGEANFDYHDARFSRDGERLLYVRSKAPTEHELISCTVATWRCRVVVNTANDVVSPVELEKDIILFSSSPPTRTDNRQVYVRHDLYTVKAGSPPVQLTHFSLPALYNLNVVGEKILFGAYGIRRSSVLGGTDNVLADPRSEIFECAFDRTELRVLDSDGKLEPRFLIGGLSIRPSASQDGQRVAFLNTALGKGAYRYELVVADTVSGSRSRLSLEGIRFSDAAFAEGDVLYNELFSDRYRVRAWSPLTGATSEVFEIGFSAIDQLPRLKVSVEAGHTASLLH